MSGPAPSSHPLPSKQARLQAASRPRRVIFNDDAHDLAQEDADTPEGFLGHRIAPLAGTHVGTIAWSVLCGQFDAPCYDSHVQPIYGDAHGGPMHYWPNVTRNVKSLTQNHRCPLHLVSDFAHAHDMESFASIRMNDVHDSFLGPNALTVWKQTHPQYLVDTQDMLPECELYTSAQDFRHEPVRQRKLEIIEEISQRYDVDGFELDYIRHPVLFGRVMRGEPCTETEIETITSMMRQIRQITEAAARERGRPILIATRTPDTFALCRGLGMDIQAWLSEDLVDILIAGGGYAPCSLPTEEWVEAGRAHGTPVYPCVNLATAAGVAGGAYLEGVRGLASNWYRAGADGLYFWNLGTPFEFMTGAELIAKRKSQYACLDEVGDPQLLIDRDKVYGVDRFCGGAHEYYRLCSSPWPLPMRSKGGILRTGVIGRVPLAVGDDVAARPPARVELEVTIDDGAWDEVLLFRLNGKELSDGTAAPGPEAQERILHYPVPPSVLLTGRNDIEVAARHADLPDGTVNVTAMRLKVDYS